ncbi:MAG TPA: hypothetical protein VJ912_01090, partial [Candidatus Nanoarchaeia archaeon]|nr:hypothetical protein [Candidatus Nanoarchaeia archaeon]
TEKEETKAQNKESNEQEETKKKSSSKETKKTKKNPKDFEKKVIEMAKKGYGPEKIGLELKKQGNHPKEQDKKISKILKENEIYENPDIKNVEAKLKRIQEHYSKNKQDKRAMREKDRIFSKLRKLKKHFGIEIKKKK